MASVETFSPAMLETYFRSRRLAYQRDADGDYRVAFAYDEELGCALDCWFLIGGRDRQILAFRAVGLRPIPRSEFSRVIELCNEWNRDRRWPKAYLYARAPDDPEGAIYLEENIDLAPGIHQDLLDDWLDTMRSAAVEFWIWAHREKGL
ncbi:MAG: YbjN domain-containing protein [Chloroflexota bacterium]|nr:YbjN domain-containing protein [Dehalococcoidia bacterium]MDW8253391.1 YbjN domain-containing protein [Chloroflexota bacterium]